MSPPCRLQCATLSNFAHVSLEAAKTKKHMSINFIHQDDWELTLNKGGAGYRNENNELVGGRITMNANNK